LRRHDTAGLHDQGRPAGDADGAAAPRRAAGWPVTLPRVRLVRRYDTHRLIPAKYADGGASVLADIADDDAHLRDIFDLDNATNDRLLAENGLLPGIGIHELVFGVPYYRIVNAAFCHAHPLGSRFNGPDRGAWYAAFEPETAQAEIAFHKWVELAEVGWTHEELTYDDYHADFSAESPARGARYAASPPAPAQAATVVHKWVALAEVGWTHEALTYDDYLADFSAEFHALRDDARFAACLSPDSYVASQDLARDLLDTGSL